MQSLELSWRVKLYFFCPYLKKNYKLFGSYKISAYICNSTNGKRFKLLT